MSWVTYPSRARQAEALAAQVAQELHAAVVARGTARLAVPGGTTPALFLEALAQQVLPWSAITVTLTDERQVPPDHARSNARLLREHLLDAVPAVRFVPLFEEPSVTQQSVPVQTLAKLETLLPLDVCVLGMGTDGHIASLFPEAAQLEQGLALNNPQPLLAMSAAHLPEPRLSLSLAAILSATHLHLLMSGTEKEQVLHTAQLRVEQGAPRLLPIEALLEQAAARLTIHYAS